MKKVLAATALVTLAVGVSPAMAQVGSGIYIRVDAGGGFSTNMTLKDTNAFAPSSTLGGLTYSGDAGNSVIGSGGVGIRLSPVFRIDLTASYMPWFRFNGHDNAGAGLAQQVALPCLLEGAVGRPRVLDDVGALEDAVPDLVSRAEADDLHALTLPAPRLT